MEEAYTMILLESVAIVGMTIAYIAVLKQYLWYFKDYSPSYCLKRLTRRRINIYLFVLIFLKTILLISNAQHFYAYYCFLLFFKLY